MSFKYRFILSFVLLEIFFIVLIIGINFWAIQNSSKKLIEDKIKSNVTFLDQLLKVPISIFDLATLDNLVESTQDLKYINSIVVLDAQHKVLSKLYNFSHESLEKLMENKSNRNIQLSNETYVIRYQKLMEEDIFLGSMFLVFDISENTNFIAQNKERTIIIVLIEIFISTILSYFIGSRLTDMLENLSEVATHIGEAKEITIPYQDKKDEIGTLSRSMKQMRVDLRARNDKLRTLAMELNKQKNELIEANKSKDDFLANMSHELKTPLNSINVISSVMMKNRKGELNEDHVKNLSIINNCGNDLLFLINDVLDISKLEAGEMELNYETIPFGQMMTRIKDMIEPQVKAKALNFVYECDSGVEFIYSDRNRIKQIIKNLLSNALKFTANGNITLKALQEEQNIKISVEDEGIGIPQEKLEHIFDRFKQVDGTTTRNYGGTGLGLAISKELASLLGGDITVSSMEGKGTTFTLMLPMNQDKVEVPKSEANEQSKEEVNPQSVQPEINTAVATPQMKAPTQPIEQVEAKDTSKKVSNSVLLLNNDPLSFMSAVIDLNKHMSVSQVNNSEQALNKLKQSVFDVVILDLKDVEDKELDAFLAQQYQKMILVYDKNNEPQAQIKSKVAATFEKPFDKNAFIEEIKS